VTRITYFKSTVPFMSDQVQASELPN